MSNNETENPDAFVYITYLTPPAPGVIFTVGVGYVGTVCRSYNQKYLKSSVNSWVTSDLGLSRVRYTLLNYLNSLLALFFFIMVHLLHLLSLKIIRKIIDIT